MIVYKTTNLINSKIYVGYDTKNDPEYLGSGKYYLRAEKKYGKTNFRKAIIDCDADFDVLCQKEIFWIDKLDARNPDVGYNIAKGGEGRSAPLSAETKLKISRSLCGHRRSEESRRKQSITTIGTKCCEETRLKISAALKGKSKSKEHIEQLRISHKGNKSALGCKHSYESKQKQSKKLKGRVAWNKGMRNGQL